MGGISLSKTKKVAKLTSEISSSARITGAVVCVSIPPVPIEADAPPASDNAPLRVGPEPRPEEIINSVRSGSRKEVRRGRHSGNQARKGMPSPRLGEDEFKRRFLDQFQDPAFSYEGCSEA